MENNNNAEPVYKQCHKLQDQLLNIVDKLETLDDIRDFRSCFKNLFNAVETSLEDKQLKAECKMMDELETLKKIKELLDK